MRSRILGTIEKFWQVGLLGPIWDGASGAMEAKDKNNLSLVVARGADPVGPNDFVTKWSAPALSATTPMTDSDATYDYTTPTRLVLPDTLLTANRAATLSTTGSLPLQLYIIDSYNNSGFTLTVKFGLTTL